MSFDFGEVLGRAWQITWKHKILWVFGLLNMVIGLLFLPLGLAPVISIFLAEDIPFWFEEPAYMFVFFGIFVLLMIASFFIGALTQAAISVGALRAEREDERLFFTEILKASLPYFWRFLGIMALLAGGVLLVMLSFFAVQTLVSLLTLGLGAMCLVPLQFLLYPLMIVVYAWQEQALASIVVDDLSVLEAAKRGWQVFRKNLLSVVLVTLILYLGVGMISGFISIPMMVPFFAIPFVLIEEVENTRAILIAASLCLVAYLPLLAVLQSGVLTYMKSGWMLTYLRLTHSPEAEVAVSHSA
ncbi:MAG: hypothetical protein PVJ21_03770 [Anaerolineales bacterium]